MSNMTTPPDDKQNTEVLNADAVDGATGHKQQQVNEADATFDKPSSVSSAKPPVNQTNANNIVKETVEKDLAEKVTSKKSCENCGFELDGPFCGRCGQPERTTIKFFGSVILHFLDDIFGYDSRAGRTVFPLIFRPGFLTCEYFKGRRVHYVPPLRLYFFISIMFFLMLEFVTDDSVKELQQIQQAQGQVAIANISKQINQLEQKMAADGYKSNYQDKRQLESLNEKKFQAIKEVEEQITKLQASIAELNPDDLPVEQLESADKLAIKAMELTINGLQMNLDEHPNYLGVKKIQDRIATFDNVYELSQGKMSEEDQNKRDALEEQLVRLMSEDFDKAKSEEKENFEITRNFKPNFSWLSAEQNQQFEAFLVELEEKAKVAFEQDAAPLVTQVLNVLPQMMFFLLPIFALILKIFYLFSKRYYMEHLTVALHSHAFIFVVLMVLAIVSSLFQYLPVDEKTALEMAEYVVLALVFWMPIYLFLMQKKVYRQGVFMTLCKYFIVGMTYVVLLTMATLIAFFWGLAHT